MKPGARLAQAYLDGYLATEEERRWAQKANEWAQALALRAPEHDRLATFPHEGLDLLVSQGYTSLTLPRDMGGADASLRLFLNLQERLAMGDPSLALGVGWHLSLLLSLRETGAWPREVFASLARAVVEEGALVNSCASERETGSPSRGARPTTRALLTPSGYVLRGRKTWATLSPRLTHFLVTATLAEEPGEPVGEFLVERSVPGLEVEETWDSLSLRASGTHDVVLMDACVARSALVERYVPPQGSRRLGDGGGPLLHIPALYLGIALAAWGDALDFAWSHRPRSLPGPIAQLPSVEEQVGRMGMHLQAAHAALYEAAARWDAASPEERIRQRPSLGAVKVFALEAALEVVDLAMRLVGGLSLSRGLPFERYYRDVRAGLHNPPMADVALRALGHKALEEAKPPAPEEGAAAP